MQPRICVTPRHVYSNQQLNFVKSKGLHGCLEDFQSLVLSIGVMRNPQELEIHPSPGGSIPLQINPLADLTARREVLN